MRKFKNDRLYNIGNSELGRAGEYRVASELILRGHMIYMPSVDNGVDLVIDDMKTVQIKCGQKQPFKSQGYDFKWYRFSFHKAYSKTEEKPHILPNELDVDFVICWAIDDDEFYIIPSDVIRGKTGISFTSDEDKRTQVKWNKWLPYRNAWGLLGGDEVEDINPREELECKQCGYKWLPLAANPTRCPHCNGRWYQKMYDYICKRCGGAWHSKLEQPSLCPHCHSTLWNIEKEANNRPEITCVRCGHKWQPTIDKPERCPRCHRRRYLGGIHKECKQCGHLWFSMVNITYQCPKCHSYKWNKPKSEIVSQEIKEKELIYT